MRALDFRDPYLPHEIAYYLPESGVPESGGRTVTTNNVEVDDRAYISFTLSIATDLACNFCG